MAEESECSNNRWALGINMRVIGEGVLEAMKLKSEVISNSQGGVKEC